ncbi:hypothetical protein HDG32_005305 [Paraburkholderia sp. CI2]|uniref:hypothetical protein n=1 Tax=Paraburkholderia sp. CI2 TaxID=2723093 RepID=UPI001608E4B9|nr:hypothetical protein [Paraburkholderia sp. CI2]MBB5469158.1 hypothetical protein [Paraburkholderia sp. CI2]
MSHDLKLRVVFDMVDRAARPLKSVMSGTKGLSREIAETKKQLGELGRQQKQLTAFRNLKRSIKESGLEMRAASDKARALRQQLDALEGPAVKKLELAKQLKSAKAAFDQNFKSLQAINQLTGNKSKTSAYAAEYRKLTDAQLAARKEILRIQEAQKNLAGQTPINLRQLRDLRRQYTDAQGASEKLRVSYRERLQVLRRTSGALQQSGIDTRKLAQHETSLRTSIEKTSASLERQDKRLRSMAAAREHLGKSQALASNMAVAGYAARSTGGRMVGGIEGALDAAKQYEQQVAQFRALGIGASKLHDAISFADKMDVKGLSKLDKVKLLKETFTITRDMHHAEEMAPILARMKVGIETVMAGRGHGEGHGEQAEQMLMDLVKTTELRGSLKSPAAFKQAVDNATKAYVASGGTVKPEDFLNAIKTGGVAAKQLGDNAFYFGLLHTMQEMGGFRAGTGLMSAYTNWAQGRTTQQSGEDLVKLGLIDKKSVKYGKTGHVTKIMGDALKQVDLYKTDPFEYLMKVVIPKINPTGKLNDQQVIGKISQLFSSRKGGDLFSSLYLERANILKHRESAPKAFGVDALYSEGMGTAYGGEMDAFAKKATLEKELGEKILPVYNRALGLTASLIDRVTGFTERHQTVTKALVVGLAGLGLLIGAGGTITLGLASMIGPLALTQYGLSMLGMQGGILRTVFSGLASLFRGGLVGALQIAGKALMTLGRAAMANPILAVTGLVAMAAFYIWEHWDTLGPKFKALWASISGAFSAAGDWIKEKWHATVEWFKTKLGSIGEWFSSAGPRFIEMGRNLISGLVEGITAGLGAVKDAITTVANSTVAWFKEKLGIHSPSRVFGMLGGFIGQGAALGIEGERPRVAGAVARLAGTAANAFSAGASLFASDKPMFDRRGPMAVAPMSAAAGATTYTINFNFPPGGSMPDSSALATIETRFRQLLEQHERDKARRAGSNFSDRG